MYFRTGALKGILNLIVLMGNTMWYQTRILRFTHQTHKQVDFPFFYFEVLGAPLRKESKSPPLGGANNGRN